MEMSDANWWGNEEEFDSDISARLQSKDPKVRDEARELLIARNRRRAQGTNPFTPPAPAPRQPNAPQAPQDAPRQAFRPLAPRRAPSAQSAFVDEFGPVAQGNHLQGMIAGVTKAYRDENRSRVEQAAAQQERDFEMEKERLRQESLLRRLAIEQEEREKDRILQRQLATGVTRKRLVNGRWEDV